MVINIYSVEKCARLIDYSVEKGVNSIDFRADLTLHKIFDGNFDIDNISLLLSAKIPNKKLEPHKTGLIFDEIQDCPNARLSLKYFFLMVDMI